MISKELPMDPWRNSMGKTWEIPDPSKAGRSIGKNGTKTWKPKMKPYGTY